VDFGDSSVAPAEPGSVQPIRPQGPVEQPTDEEVTPMPTHSPERVEWSDPGPIQQFERRVLRPASGRWWWAPLLAGLSWFIIAWLVLRADVGSLATVGVLVGVAFVAAAANEAALGGLMVGGWKLAHYVLAAFFALSAGWAFVRPVDTFFALASVLGLILFLQGAFSISRGIALRDVSPYWWLELFSGIVLTLLAIWVSVSDRVFDLAGRTAFILLWVGIMAVFRGLSDMVLAFSMLGYAKSGDGGHPNRPVDAEDHPTAAAEPLGSGRPAAART
jgi:uncharacterized membrane protein HdeD (DUF308 family)